MPIMESHRDVHCTVCIVSRSIAVRHRACLVKTSEVIMNAIRVADRSRVERSGLPHGLRLKVGIITAKSTHNIYRD